MSVTCAACSHSYADEALYCPNCGRPKARTAPTDALVGTVLGERFEVQALLGQGASGTIYRAEHVTLKRRVAIKVLHAELSRDDLAVERFRREATTVADIDNEHIVEIHDFGRTPDGRLYLAMELLEGDPLDTVLAREPQLSVERTADILIQVGEALMEAHAIGYVHRDLRPHNVFLAVRRGKPNFVKLLDFGLAKLVDPDEAAASTSLGMTFGDPRYMSPEQAKGERIDRRSDIYQLGCVAYEMLTGAPPFAGARVFDILTKQVTDAPVPLPVKRPGVPLWMESAVAKMLAKDPANRFATTTRMVAALRRGLETGEIMSDEIARRKESVPPPSVSRVMEKFGVTEDGQSPNIGQPVGVVPVPTAAVLAPVVAAPVVAVAPPMSESTKRPVQDSVDLLRKRTGTPKVGVPVLGPESSQSWYDDGDGSKVSALASAQDDHDEYGDRAVSRRNRRFAPSSSSSSSSSSSTSDMLDELPRSRRWGLYAVVAGAVLLLGGAAFALSRSGTKHVEPPVAPVATTMVLDAAPSAIIEDASVPDAAMVTAVGRPSGGRTNGSGGRTTGGGGGGGGGTANTGGGRPASPNFGGDFPVLGSDPTPTVVTQPGPPGPSTAPITHVEPLPTPATPPTTGSDEPSGVNGEGPEDPYGTGGGGASPSSPSSSLGPAGGQAEARAEELAGTGSQQLAGGDTSGAAASFQAALQLDARNASATMGLGEIALRQGLFGDAIAHLKKAVKLAPRSSRAHSLLGEAYADSGNNDAALASFEKALALDPNNARAKGGYAEASARAAGFK